MNEQDKAKFFEANEKAKSLFKEAESIVFDDNGFSTSESLTNPDNLKRMKKIIREQKEQISIMQKLLRQNHE